MSAHFPTWPICPTCGDDLSKLHPLANVAPHMDGTCLRLPSLSITRVPVVKGVSVGEIALVSAQSLVYVVGCVTLMYYGILGFAWLAGWILRAI